VTDQPIVAWNWLADNADLLAAATLAHAGMAVLAVAMGFAISVGLTLLAVHWRFTRTVVLGAAGVLYTIPSLALFALLIPFTGLSLATSEIALVSYTLLILVRSMLDGLAAVAPDALDAADGLGLSRWQRLWRVEVPLAAPIIVAGLRVATVTTVGLVAVTALIGQSNLGSVIVDIGIRRQFPTAILAGLALSIALAVAADLGLLGVQRMLTPWARARHA